MIEPAIVQQFNRIMDFLPEGAKWVTLQKMAMESCVKKELGIKKSAIDLGISYESLKYKAKKYEIEFPRTWVNRTTSSALLWHQYAVDEGFVNE